MIKVIKHGNTIFKAICQRCGCEFIYGTEDIDNYLGYKVGCPDCGELIPHQSQPSLQENNSET